MKKALFSFIFCLAFVFVSCEKDDEGGEEIITIDDIEDFSGYYVLNRGNSTDNNASIEYFNFETNHYFNDIYKEANKSALGESAESMLIYGSKMYVAVSYSDIIAVLDLKGNLIEQVSTKKDGESRIPRGLSAIDGKVYFTCYYGHSVAVLDTLSLKIEKEVNVGRYPEQLAISNGKIYVANSGGMDFPDYGKTISVIDISSFQVEKEIEVIINPCIIKANNKGDLYVISTGNYGDVKSTLQKIDIQTNEVEVIGYASKMSLVNDKLYTIYDPFYGDEEISFSKYNAITGELIDENFLKDSLVLSSPYSIDVDPKTEKIYICDGSYTVGDMYIFSSDGTKLESFDIKGYDTMGVWFYYSK